MIQSVLGVPSGFISTWKQRYLSAGVSCFRLGYKGSRSYLSAAQRAQITRWLATQSQPSVASFASDIQTQFGVVYRSSQHYYALLSQAGYRWKKTQARSPKADPFSMTKISRFRSAAYKATRYRLGSSTFGSTAMRPAAKGWKSLPLIGSCFFQRPRISIKTRCLDGAGMGLTRTTFAV